MSLLSPLLDVQELDLACDQLAKRRLSLPERAALDESRARAAALDEAHTALVERRETLARSERELGGEVSTVAAKAKEADDSLYSGVVKARKELEGLQEEIRLLKGKQSKLEEQELELLENIDGVENEISDNRADFDRARAEIEEVESALRKAEAEIDAELARLAQQRPGPLEGIPAEIASTYERLRTKERLHGRAAALLAKGGCGGCKVRLPVLEYNQMKAQPEDALIFCVHCSRVLVR